MTSSPQTLPPLRTARKIFPSVMPAAVVHASIAALTQAGTASVRTRFPLPQLYLTRLLINCSANE